MCSEVMVALSVCSTVSLAFHCHPPARDFLRYFLKDFLRDFLKDFLSLASVETSVRTSLGTALETSLRFPKMLLQRLP